jgi:hypothetical protein
VLTVHRSRLDSGRSGSWLWATRRCERKGTIDQPGVFSTDTHEKYVSIALEQLRICCHLRQYSSYTGITLLTQLQYHSCSSTPS